MIQRLNERLNFPLIFLAYLTCLLYFVMFAYHWLILTVFVFSLALALYRKYFLIIPLLVLISVFFFWIKMQDDKLANSQPQSITHIQPIADTIEVNGNLLSFRGQSEGRIFQAYYTLKTEQEQKYFKNLDKNTELTVMGKLELPESQRNFNGFDMQKYLATQNIYRVIKIKSITHVQEKSDFDLHLLRRQAILYCQNNFPAPMSSYMTGLLFGYLGKDFNEMGDIYTSLGIIHLFALSGMQVNFFIDKLRKILLRLGMRREHLDSVQIPFSVFYAFMTGLSVSVIRALLQKNIKAKGLDNFALTFFALLIISPKFLLTIGGTLTLFYAFIITMISWKFENLKGIKLILVESLVISLGVIPLLVLYFHTFQPLSILLTFGFSFIFDVLLLPLLVILLALAFLGVKLTFFNGCFDFLEGIVIWVGNLVHYPLVLGTPTIFLFVAMLILIGLLIDFIHHRKIRWLLILVFAGLLFFSKEPVHPAITMVDIGQGDSFLLEDKFNRQTVLIDTGGKLPYGSQNEWQKADTSANADQTLIPYLQSRGIGRVDVVLLTHTDADHMGDFLDLSHKIQIGQVWVSQGALTKPEFVKTLKASGVAVHVAVKGDKIPIFDSELDVLTSGYTGKGDNNDSLVTYCNAYHKSFLFTGDLEKEGEQKLLADYPKLKVDVLKVGHHGSKTSSAPEFIAHIQPKIALISAGVNNRFGHPKQETLDTLDNQRIKIYRTDQEGAVRFTEKNGEWEIETVK